MCCSQLYPTEKALDVQVEPWKLTLTYPLGTPDSVFTLLVGTFAQKPTLAGWEDLPGLRVTVSGSVEADDYDLSFAGANGGSGGSPIQDFEYWNFTYALPGNLTGAPQIILDFALA